MQEDWYKRCYPEYNRTCPGCGIEFNAYFICREVNNAGKIPQFCSEPCRKEHYKVKMRQYHQEAKKRKKHQARVSILEVIRESESLRTSWFNTRKILSFLPMETETHVIAVLRRMAIDGTLEARHLSKGRKRVVVYRMTSSTSKIQEVSMIDD